MKIKKATAVIAALCIMFTIPTPVVSAISDRFSDIQGHWAEAMIDEAVELKIVNGYEDGTFMPDKQITREEFYKLVVNILTFQYDTTDTIVRFTDTVEDGWYIPSLKIAIEAQLTSGYTDGTFGIGRSITRQEAAKAAGTIINATNVDNTKAGAEAALDVEEIADWALPYVDLMYKKEYIGGDDAGNFRPDESLTRAEAAKILLNIKKSEAMIGTDPSLIDEDEEEEIDDTVYADNDCTRLHGKTKSVFNEGRGSKSDPYVIYTEYQLNHIREHVGDDNYYVLANDIIITNDFTTVGAVNAKETDWTIGNFEPIGTKSIPFVGVLDGGGNTISGLYIKGLVSGSPAGYAGLFGATDENAEVFNLTIKDSIITGNQYTAGFVGYNKGLVTDCILGSGSEITGQTYTGGICGASEKTLTDNTNEGIVEGLGRSVGGIVGYMGIAGTAAESCVNNGTVIGADATGGIIGTFASASIGASVVSNCVNTGRVECPSFVAGGIAGYMNGTNNRVTITDCKNTGYVSGKGVEAGIAGMSEGRYATIQYCVNYGNITGSAAGGIVGHNNATISYCKNEGNIFASSNAGGIVAYNQEQGKITRSYNNGNISADSYAGGLAGENLSLVSNCYNSGIISGTKYIGGLVGKNSGTFSNTYNSGNVEGQTLVGALAGVNNAIIKDSYWLLSIAKDISSGELGISSSIINVRSMTADQMMGGESIYGVSGNFCDMLNQNNSGNSNVEAEDIWEYVEDYPYPDIKPLSRI